MKFRLWYHSKRNICLTKDFKLSLTLTCKIFFLKTQYTWVLGMEKSSCTHLYFIPAGELSWCWNERCTPQKERNYQSHSETNPARQKNDWLCREIFLKSNLRPPIQDENHPCHYDQNQEPVARLVIGTIGEPTRILPLNGCSIKLTPADLLSVIPID